MTINLQKESPPALREESYRPPRSKYSLCCCLLGGGGLNPSSPDCGYPPSTSWPRRYPHPVLIGGGGCTPIQSWPGMGTLHNPDLAWGYPPFLPGMGYPPFWPVMEVTPIGKGKDGVPPPGVDGQIPVKTLPSPFLWNVGGKNADSKKGDDDKKCSPNITSQDPVILIKFLYDVRNTEIQ